MNHYNFCAGPAMLPEAVMVEAQHEFRNFNQLGVSVMELSHRGPQYLQVAHQAEADLRGLMAIPEHYHVYFMHGGARAQFSAIALNLLAAGEKADYLLSGHWSVEAAKEAARFADVKTLEGRYVDEQKRHSVQSQITVRTDARYLHYCPNETIEGVALFNPPDVSVPLVADMSSCILSGPIDVSRYALIYAGAQKNIGPAGLGIVILDPALLREMHHPVPAVFDYRLMAKNESMYNTPPTFAWYLAGKVFQWLKAEGGLGAMAEHNRHKAELLYQFIDNSDYYCNRVAPAHRSLMNVPFQLADAGQDSEFLVQAERCGLHALKGHRAVGGMRASIYNAMPLEGVKSLIHFMEHFDKGKNVHHV